MGKRRKFTEADAKTALFVKQMIANRKKINEYFNEHRNELDEDETNARLQVAYKLGYIIF